jgi:hypothetical protein
VMFVLFDPMYQVRSAALVPADVVRTHATRVDFTASDRVFANDAMLARGWGLDRTPSGSAAVDRDARAGQRVHRPRARRPHTRLEA